MSDESPLLAKRAVVRKIYTYDQYLTRRPAPWYVYPLVWLGIIKPRK